MKNLIIFTLFILCFSAVIAQTPDEVKTAKKELKYYKKHINEYIYTKSECVRKDSIIEEQEVLTEKLTRDVNNLNQKLILSASDKTEVVDTRIMPDGKSFQIQIGVYKNDELTQYLTEPKYMGFELDNDLIRYHLGYFKDYLEAKKFLEIVRRMGIKDAFIAEYLDGKRVNYTNINYNSPINKTLSNTNTSNKTTNISTTSNTNVKPVSKNVTASDKSTTNNDKVKMQNNWEIKKDEEGNEIIMINTRNKTASNSTNKGGNNTINEEGNEEDYENIEIVKEPIKSTTPTKTSTTIPSTTTTTTNSAPKTTSTTTSSTTTTKPSNTNTNSTSTNTNVKMEKNWEMGEDEEGNQIIRIMPKKP